MNTPPIGGANGAALAAHELNTTDEATGLAGRDGFGNQGTNSKIEDSADAQMLATLRASCALRGGHGVQELAAGGFAVTWRGLCRECRGPHELEDHVRPLGVRT